MALEPPYLRLAAVMDEVFRQHFCTRTDTQEFSVRPQFGPVIRRGCCRRAELVRRASECVHQHGERFRVVMLDTARLVQHHRPESLRVEPVQSLVIRNRDARQYVLSVSRVIHYHANLCAFFDRLLSYRKRR